MTRRAMLALAALPFCTAPARALPGAEEAVQAEWALFRRRFLLPEGRVVDTGNGGISHSEGQGWAMLGAVRAGDREGFDLILGWTRRVLARRGDALHAWRYRPEGGGVVDDPNNATDGDLMIAWALLEAARRWDEPAYAAQGTAIARDVLRLLVREVAGDVVLLPGLQGFERRGAVIVNPSYYCFPAFRVLARAVPDPLWIRLAADGLVLLERARFGRWGLPADWVALPTAGGAPVPAPGWAPRFSYDAIRVPLYLAWAGLAGEPAVARATRFWLDPRHPRLPAWADLSNDVISPYAAPPGFQAVARLAIARHERRSIPTLPVSGMAPDYYSSALILLARLALWDSALRAV